MKRDKNYRMSSTTKKILATILDPVERSRYKNAMIDAEITAATPYKSEKKSRKDTNAL